MTPIAVIAQATIEEKLSKFAKTYQVDETRAVRLSPVPSSSTDLEIDFAPGLYTKMAFLMIFSDGPLTIKANSSGAPDWTMTLTAADGDCCMLSGAAITALKGTTLTKLYVTNGDNAADRTITCLSGEDITP